MTDTIGYTATMRLKRGNLDAFQRAADDAVKIVRNNEPGTIDYRWYLSPDGKHVKIHQRFEDSKALVAHMKGRAVQEVLPEKILKTADLVDIEVFGTVSAEARRILDGMDAKYARPLAGFTRLRSEVTVHPVVR